MTRVPEFRIEVLETLAGRHQDVRETAADLLESARVQK
jgi:hypothetical protein